MKTSEMNDKSIDNIFRKFEKLPPVWDKLIEKSFLSEERKMDYREMVEEKFKQLEIKKE